MNGRYVGYVTGHDPRHDVLSRIFADRLGARERHPAFQAALDAMGVPAENTLYVGNDRHRDIYGAREAGMQTMMFDSEQGTKSNLDCVPDYTITGYHELLEILGLGQFG